MWCDKPDDNQERMQHLLSPYTSTKLPKMLQ